MLQTAEARFARMSSNYLRRCPIRLASYSRRQIYKTELPNLPHHVHWISFCALLLARPWNLSSMYGKCVQHALDASATFAQTLFACIEICSRATNDFHVYRTRISTVYSLLHSITCTVARVVTDSSKEQCTEHNNRNNPIRKIPKL